MWDIVYLSALFMLTLLSLFYYILAITHWIIRREKKRAEIYLPSVTVQIPVYNDPIAVRCVKAALQFDYPDFEVIVIDDSNDGYTSKLLQSIRHPRYKYIHRLGRRGFKAGALNDALKISKGEIIVVFDADFIPPRDFLRRIVQPFTDPRVGYVQARWSFENPTENIITLFASTALSVYHRFFYPIQDAVGAVFLSGAAMAIRRSALEEVGGWREGTLAEDAELTFRLNAAGYRGVYLPDLSADNQVPFTLHAFIKQQMRWCAGVVEALLLGAKRILRAKIPFHRKLLLLFLPLLNFSYPIVLSAIVSSVALFLLDISPIAPATALALTALLSGYIVLSILALKEEGICELPKVVQLVLSIYIIGPLLSLSNTYALAKLAMGRLEWFRTPKRVGTNV